MEASSQWKWLYGGALLITTGVAFFSQILRFRERKSYEQALHNKDRELGKASRALKKYMYSGKYYKQPQSYEKEQEQINSKQSMWKVVVTGGPCAGKTTAMTAIAQALEERQIKALIVPEAATMLFKGGASIVSTDFDQMQGARFQHALMKIQINLEDQFMRVAQNSPDPVVILCDRGLMDGSAYVDHETWATVLDDIGVNTVQMRDMRYHLVLHLVTAANGAEDFYDHETNESRYEDPASARLVDKRLIDAWIGHTNFKIIDNNVSSFKVKIDRCINEVLRVVGRPRATTFYKKYLIQNIGQNELLEHCDRKCEVFTIQQTFLSSKGGKNEKIKMRQQGSSGRIYSAYRREEKTKGRVVETKRIIAMRQYLSLMSSADENRMTLIKKRFCFGHEDWCFVLDHFVNKEFDFTLLRLVTSYSKDEAIDQEVFSVPPYLKVLREVTDEEVYQLESISLKNWEMPAADRAKLSENPLSPKSASFFN